jgi:PAS domain S-box-containing protein
MLKDTVTAAILRRPPAARSAFSRYAVAVAAVTAATGVALWLRPFSYSTPFVFYFPAIIVIAWFSGFRPGFLAAVLASLATNYWILAPHGRFSTDAANLLRTLFFGATFATVCWLAELAQRQLGSEIKERQRQLQTVMDALPVGVILCDAQGRVRQTNPAVRAIWGSEPTVGRALQLWSVKRRRPGAPDKLEPSQWPIMRALQSGETVFGEEMEIEAADGVWKTLLANALPLFGPSGKVAGAVGVHVDITTRKRSEQALIRSEKLAAAGRMAATIAHEINNPLAAAMNALYLACADAALPATARANLDVVERELEMVAHIARQTLGFYREPVASSSAVSLPKVLDEVLNLYGPRLQNSSIVVQRRYDSEQVQAVRGELRQMISNLIANSIDAMPRGGTLQVRTFGPLHLRKRPVVALAVADSGEGIAPQHMAQIFEPFFTTKQAVGTGLGLWVTRELVKKNEGCIRVRSRAGCGTVFSLWLPTEQRSEVRDG